MTAFLDALRTCSIDGCEGEVVARGLCGRHYARLRKHGSTDLPARSMKVSPGWGHGKYGNGPYWTKPRLIAALKRYAASTDELPSSSDAWNKLKKGRMDLPTSGRIIELFRTMARAWLAIGIDRKQVTMLNSRWSKAEKNYLLEHAGSMTLQQIARRLNRSYASVKTMIGSKGMGITARANQGFWSAAQISREYGTSYHRVQTLLASGVIEGTRHQRRTTWLVDPAALTPEVIAILKTPTRTHKTTPADLGDYRQRYGVKRSSLPLMLSARAVMA